MSAKTIFLHPGDGIIRRDLFHGKVEEYLATEQPQVSNKRADLVVRNSDGEIHHVEFQTTNESALGLRMLGYYYYFLCTHERHVVQTVLYMGREERAWASGTLLLLSGILAWNRMNYRREAQGGRRD